MGADEFHFGIRLPPFVCKTESRLPSFCAFLRLFVAKSNQPSMNKLILVPIAAAFVAALSGCMHGGAYEARNAQRYDLENKAPFALMDSMVQRSVTSSGIQKQTLEDGRLRVVANVRNREARRIQVQISCVFKDENSVATGDETPWTNLILTESAQEAVEFVSMNNKAKNFTVRVRQAH